MSKDQTKDLLKFLKPFGDDITDVVMWLRDFAWDLCPQANELIYDNFNAVAFGWSPTDKVGHTICYPDNILLGDGNQITHGQTIVKSISAKKRPGKANKAEKPKKKSTSKKN